MRISDWSSDVCSSDLYPVTSNDTPYSRCLAKLGTLSGYDNLPTFAVGSVVDKTGKLAAGDEGFVISQGATEMVISALYKTRKARLVERFDLRLVNAELQFSKNHKIGRASCRDRGCQYV